MRLEPGHIVFPLLVLLAALVVLALDTNAEMSCRGADDQRKHGFGARAEKEYAAILEEEPGNNCAKEGMPMAVEKECESADAAARAYLLINAQKAYQGILAAHPGNKCARKGLRKLVTEMCVRAKLLKDRGATEAAGKAYTAILAIEPLRKVPPCRADGLVPPPAEGPTEQLVVVQGKGGKDGTDGKDGKDGTDGKDGKDGNTIVIKPWSG